VYDMVAGSAGEKDDVGGTPMGHYYTAGADEACGVVVARLKEILESHGVRVVPTFDLQAARDSYACPHHETSKCNCQYVTLLAYGPDPELGTPRLIAAHGCNGQTWLSLPRAAEVPDEQKKGYRAFETTLIDALAEATVESDPLRQAGDGVATA
jgi:hypothetical protein